MRVFLRIFKTTFLEELQYKGAFISGILCQLAFGFMYVFLYQAFYENGIPQNFDLKQMATYVWLGQAFFALFSFTDINRKDITNSIKSGDVSYQLIKPISLYDYWFYRVLSTGISKMIVRAIPIFLICSLLPSGLGLGGPSSPLAFLFFIIAIILGAILVTAIKMFGYLLILYTLNDRGVTPFVTTICSFLSGAYIPIPLMPKVMQSILNFLPFRYVNDLAYRIYIGNLDFKTFIVQILVQIGWIFAIVFLGKLAYKQKSKALVVQGG